MRGSDQSRGAGDSPPEVSPGQPWHSLDYLDFIKNFLLDYQQFSKGKPDQHSTGRNDISAEQNSPTFSLADDGNSTKTTQRISQYKGSTLVQ